MIYYPMNSATRLINIGNKLHSGSHRFDVLNLKWPTKSLTFLSTPVLLYLMFIVVTHILFKCGHFFLFSLGIFQKKWETSLWLTRLKIKYNPTGLILANVFAHLKFFNIFDNVFDFRSQLFL